MKVFTCTNFEGHYPVGAAAVVVARDEKKAKELLDLELRTQGLELGDATLTEICMASSTTEPVVLVLADGNY